MSKETFGQQIKQVGRAAFRLVATAGVVTELSGCAAYPSEAKIKEIARPTPIVTPIGTPTSTVGPSSQEAEISQPTLERRGGIVAVSSEFSSEDYCRELERSPIPEDFVRTIYLRGITDPRVLIPLTLKEGEEDVVADGEGPGVTKYEAVGFIVLHDPDRSYQFATRVDLCK